MNGWCPLHSLGMSGVDSCSSTSGTSTDYHFRAQQLRESDAFQLRPQGITEHDAHLTGQAGFLSAISSSAEFFYKWSGAVKQPTIFGCVVYDPLLFFGCQYKFWNHVLCSYEKRGTSRQWLAPLGWCPLLRLHDCGVGCRRCTSRSTTSQRSTYRVGRHCDCRYFPYLPLGSPQHQRPNPAASP